MQDIKILLLLLILCANVLGFSIKFPGMIPRRKGHTPHEHEERHFTWKAPEEDSYYKRNFSQMVEFKWGEIRVRDRFNEIRTFSDVMLYPSAGDWSGVAEWNWALGETKHNPGISVKDVMTLIQDINPKNNTYIIIASGMQEQLQLAPAALKLLRKLLQEKYIANYQYVTTDEAIRMYHDHWLKQRSVVALIHTTC